MGSFNFEKLIAWQKAVEFFGLILESTSDFSQETGHFRIKEQLESASASISMNIAEGSGRNSDKDFLKFLYYARESLYETITLLILLNKNNYLDEGDLNMLKDHGAELAKILNGLISSKRNNLQIP